VRTPGKAPSHRWADGDTMRSAPGGRITAARTAHPRAPRTPPVHPDPIIQPVALSDLALTTATVVPDGAAGG